MPNYSIIANTQFKNRSFDDLMKPLALYTEEYNKLEEAASDLETKANIWEGMANEQTDPVAYAQYKRYADDLKNQAISLSHNGLNPATRRGLLDLKKRYASEITPIEQAYANRKAQADEQRKALLQNPTLLLSRRADMTSLDDYLRNPQLGYDSYSGALLTQQVGTAASAIAKELKDYGNGKPLDNFTKTWLQQHGFTAAEVAQAINNPDSPRSSQILSTLVNNVMADSGIPQWADRSTLNQAYNYARQGLWQAVGQTNISTYEDYGKKLAAQEAMHKRVAQYTAGLQNNGMSVTPKFDRRNVRTARDMEDLSKHKDAWKRYKDYFYRDPKTGTWKMTSAGMKLYKFAQNYSSRIPGEDKKSTMINPFPEITSAQEAIENSGNRIAPGPDRGAKQFMDFVDSMGISEMAKGRTGSHQSSIMNSFMNKVNDRYDINTATEYYGQIDASQHDNVLGRLRGIASSEGEILSYKREKQGNVYKFVPDEKVDISKLKGSDIQSAIPVYGSHGNFLEVSLNNGKRITVPFENINNQFNGLVNGNIGDALTLEAYKKAGKETFTYPDGRVVPIEYAIQDALNNGFDNFMSGLGTSVVKNQETQRSYYGLR